jgi:hypothetical protein
MPRSNATGGGGSRGTLARNAYRPSARRVRDATPQETAGAGPPELEGSAGEPGPARRARGPRKGPPALCADQSNVQASERIPATIAPAVGEMFCSTTPPIPVPGLPLTLVQAFNTFVPGFSGKVVPGLPRSAAAGAAATAARSEAAQTAALILFFMSFSFSPQMVWSTGCLR